MSLFSSLNVALSGLQTTQTLLNTTTRNITNAQTTGYVRETQQALTNVAGGGGVLAGSVQRQVDLTLLNQQWANNAATNYNTTQSALLTQLDNLNGNPSEETSLSAQITALGNAFQQLSSNPTDPASAAAVISSAQNLALTFNEQTATVQNLASTAALNIGTAVTNVNTDLQKIASLNQQVVSGQAQKQNVAELQDELNDTVSDLSQYMTVNTFVDNHGYLNVTGANFVPLASSYAEVVSYSAATNQFSTSNGQINNIGGQLGANQLTVGINQPAANGNTDTYLAQLSDIAQQLTLGLSTIPQKFSGTVTAGSTVIANASDTSNLYVGETIDSTVSTEFPAGTTISGIYNVAAGTSTFQGTTAVGTATVTGVANAAAFAVGDTVVDPNFPPGTTITAINTATNTLTLSNNATASVTNEVFNQPYVTVNNAATAAATSVTASVSIPLFEPNPPVPTVPPSYSGAFQVVPTITTADLLVGAATSNASSTISAADPNYAQAAVAAQQYLLNGNSTFTAPIIGGTQTFTQALTSQTVSIGQSLSAAQTQATTLGTFGTQITQAIASGSEVNLDTELSNMVVLQNLYASNARVVQTTQKMLDDLLGLIH